MSLRKAKPIRFSPAGLSDALAEEDAFPGACAILQNLIPDPTTKNMWVCRPAATPAAVFDTTFGPKGTSVFAVVGSLIYGMLSDNFYPGKDRPFVYNLATGAFLALTVTSPSALPLTQGGFGNWTPPTMALCGINLVVTHPGFDGIQNFIGWFDTSNPAVPTWTTGNFPPLGTVTTLGFVTGGSAYTDGTYTNVLLSGGTGVGAEATIVVSGGAVTTVTLVGGGLGYVIGDVLSAPAVAIGGTGTGFSVPVSFVAASLIQLTTVPSWVQQFNGRAYLGVNPPTGQPSVIFTDPLALTVTNANQALTFGDNLPLTAAGGLPLDNELGGQIQSLLVFKGSTAIFQITGDAATTDLAINALEVATGTLSPRSICATPIGLAFIAPDGLRTINLTGQVTPPIGVAGAGVNFPFISAIYPSRLCAGCNASVLRVSLQNSSIGGTTQFQEFWYDLVRQVWSGPHTFPATQYALDPIFGNAFVMSAQGIGSSLFIGQPAPIATSSYLENGVNLSWEFQTAVLADNSAMAMSEITEMQVKTSGVGGTPSMLVNAQDENGNILNTATYNFSEASSEWDSSQWDNAVWDGQQVAVYPRRIDFPTPTVYNRLAINISGVSAGGFRISDTYIRTRTLGYMQEVA